MKKSLLATTAALGLLSCVGSLGCCHMGGCRGGSCANGSCASRAAKMSSRELAEHDVEQASYTEPADGAEHQCQGGSCATRK